MTCRHLKLIKLLGSPVVRTLCFHCCGPGFYLSLGGELRSCKWQWTAKNKQVNKTSPQIFMSKNKFLAIYNVLHVNKWQLNASLFLVSSLTSFSHNSHPITYCVGSTVKVYPNLSTSAEFYYRHPNPPSFLSWIFFFFFWQRPAVDERSNPHSLRWKCRVLITGLPGRSLSPGFLLQWQLFWENDYFLFLPISIAARMILIKLRKPSPIRRTPLLSIDFQPH